jgi:hypothetical protein
MVVYRHTIWMKNLRSQVQSFGIDKVQLVFISILFFIILLVFTIKIINTINDGIATQKRSDKIAADVARLEKDKANLEYLKSLYTSDAEQEAELRSTQNKKKGDEKIYIINLDKTPEQTPVPEITPIPEQKEERANWEQWVLRIFD